MISPASKILRRQRLATWMMCAAMALLAGRAPSVLYESSRLASESEAPAKTVNLGESELLSVPTSSRRSVCHRHMRPVAETGDTHSRWDSDRSAAFRRPHFLQTHQLGGIGCPLLC